MATEFNFKVTDATTLSGDYRIVFSANAELGDPTIDFSLSSFGAVDDWEADVSLTLDQADALQRWLLASVEAVRAASKGSEVK